MMNGRYDPITDWTRSGRTALVEKREPEIRLLLDLAFTTFLDEDGVRLSEFGFRGEDPVESAVDWCVDAFGTRYLDPTKLKLDSRSFRLFTEVAFWLSQKVGKRAYDAIRSRQPPRPDRLDNQPHTPDNAGSEVREIRDALGVGCRRLVRSTTSALLTWWLLATKRFRSCCFDWEEEEEDLSAPEDLSPKNASFAVADALWRYLCLFLDKVDASAVPVATASLFSPCSATFRYEVDKHRVASSLSVGVREVERQRKVEILDLITACIVAAEVPLDRDEAPSAWVRTALARESIKDSLFHLYRLDRTCDVALRAKALPKGIR